MSRLIFLLLTGLLVSGCGSSGGSDPATDPAPAPVPGTTPQALQPIPPPVSTARTWAVSGHVGSVGTFAGTFTYEKDANPSAEHVRGLSPNAVYTLTAWDIQAHVGQPLSSSTGMPIPNVAPVVFFRHTGFVDTSELCFNHCFFDRRDAGRLVFSNGMQTLVLTWILPAPHTTLPVEVGDWGAFLSGASHLQSGEPLTPTFQYRMVVTDSELVEG